MSIICIGRLVARPARNLVVIELNDEALRQVLIYAPIRLRVSPTSSYRHGVANLKRYHGGGYFELADDIAESIATWAAADHVFMKTDPAEVWGDELVPCPFEDMARRQAEKSVGWDAAWSEVDACIDSQFPRPAPVSAAQIAQCDTMIRGMFESVGVPRMQDQLNPIDWAVRKYRLNCEHPLVNGTFTIDPAPTPPIDPLDVECDGVKLRDLLGLDERQRRESDKHGKMLSRAVYTPAQREAVSAHWSAQLRTKVAATKEADRTRERNRVTYCEEDD